MTLLPGAGMLPDAFSADGSGGAQGSHPCTGRTNVQAGFSMVTFDNDPPNTAQTIAHGLGKTPEFYILKPYRGYTTGDAYAWHKDLDPDNYLFLDMDIAQTSNNWALLFLVMSQHKMFFQ